MSGKSFILYAILAVLLFASCLDGRHAPSEADLSAFGSYVYRLDTAKLQGNLQALIAADTSRWRADQTVRQYYSSGSDAAGAQDAEPDALNFIWFSRSGVSPDADSIVVLLRRELPRNGLDSAAFFLPSLAGDLDVVHRLAFDSLGIDINQLLPRLDYRLTQAYVRYTAGQRRGFLRPAKLLNNLDFKSGGPGYARLFDYDVPAPDYDEALRQACDPDARLAIRQVPSTKPSSASSTPCPTPSSAAPSPSTSSAAAGRCRSCPPADGASWSTSLPSSSGPSPRTPS